MCMYVNKVPGYGTEKIVVTFLLKKYFLLLLLLCCCFVCYLFCRYYSLLPRFVIQLQSKQAYHNNSYQNMTKKSNGSTANLAPVSKFELDQAVKVIDEATAKEFSKYSNNSNVDSNNLSVTLSALQQEIVSSLKSAMEQTLVAVDDKDYKQKFIKFDTPMKREIAKSEKEQDDISLEDDECDSEDENIADDENFDSESDDEDFLDTIALKRAQELRELVRNKAAETMAVKNDKLLFLMQKIASELNEWKRLHDECSIQDDAGQVDDVSDKNNQIHQRIDNMKSCLTHLSSTLETIDGELPDKLESLQQTTETILRYIKKAEAEREKLDVDGESQNEQHDHNSGFSRVERAILSRIDVNQRKQSGENGNEAGAFGDFKNIDAEKRFALFVSQSDNWSM